MKSKEELEKEFEFEKSVVNLLDCPNSLPIDEYMKLLDKTM